MLFKIKTVGFAVVLSMLSQQMEHLAYWATAWTVVSWLLPAAEVVAIGAEAAAEVAVFYIRICLFPGRTLLRSVWAGRDLRITTRGAGQMALIPVLETLVQQAEAEEALAAEME